MPDVVLIRPGCTDYDEQDRIQGTLDVPLNPHGRDQLRELCESLRDAPIEIIYSAPGEPARAMAESLGEALDVPVRECEGLRNLDQGLWQGLQIDEARRLYPRAFKQWEASPETICPPEGEMLADAAERIRKCLRKPLRKKVPFAVVASEPLATLAKCVIQGIEPDRPGPICGGGKGPLVEILGESGDADRFLKPAAEGEVRVRRNAAALQGGKSR
jgi:probable phosphoglycerate mutase